MTLLLFPFHLGNFMKNKGNSPLLALLPFVQVLLLVALAFGLFSVFLLIFLNADHLGYFFLPTLFLYCGILAAIPYILYRRRELLEIHALLGDEAFYERYPREKRKMLRKKAREEKRQLKTSRSGISERNMQ